MSTKIGNIYPIYILHQEKCKVKNYEKPHLNSLNQKTHIYTETKVVKKEEKSYYNKSA